MLVSGYAPCRGLYMRVKKLIVGRFMSLLRGILCRSAGQLRLSELEITCSNSSILSKTYAPERPSLFLWNLPAGWSSH